MKEAIIDSRTGTVTERLLTEAEVASAQAAAAAAQAAQSAAQVRSRLVEIDRASIRALREWVAAQPSAPQILKDREAEAVAERAKLK